MRLSIKQSVGKNGVNRTDDVKLIQALLNSHSVWKIPAMKLAISGHIEQHTLNLIKCYQREVAGIRYPDGRVDPNGKTFRYLTMYIQPGDVAKIQQQVQTGQVIASTPVVTKARIEGAVGLNGQTVTYKTTLGPSEKIVSEYSIQVIKMALKESGMQQAVITSTIRTPQEQASTMLKNAKKNLKKQYQLYGSAGDKVLEVYEKNKAKSDEKILALMVAKIEELAKQNKRVSKHCVPEETYKKNNIIDIGCNSTKAVNKNFSADKFTAALNKLKKDGYITTVIDETKISNQAWHIEIEVGKKSLVKYEEGTMLNAVSWINGIIC